MAENPKQKVALSLIHPLPAHQIHRLTLVGKCDYGEKYNQLFTLDLSPFLEEKVEISEEKE
jgi:hypothetical protein